MRKRHPPSPAASPMDSVALNRSIDRREENIAIRQFKSLPKWPLLGIFGCLVVFGAVGILNEGMSMEMKSGMMLFVLVAFVLYLALAVPPLPQDKLYHNFADKRCLCCRVPNTMDVASNIPFIILGMVCLWLQISGFFMVEASMLVHISWGFVFVAIILVGFGSGYYHWKPSNATLVWDRLPITLAFTSLTGIIMEEYTGIGVVLLPFLVILGGWSVYYWAKTDDLRPYVFVQGFPLMVLPCFLILFPAKYNGSLYYIYALAWYAFARVSEVNDRRIFIATGKIISGHSLKHVFSAVALAMIPRMLSIRHRLK
ncbi:hypothetical protein AAMO2058_000214300 [Amorphochlora amoebiformis]